MPENLTTTPAASGLEGYNFAYLDEGTPIAKAACQAMTDADARKRGDQTGLDTLVVHAVNDDH